MFVKIRPREGVKGEGGFFKQRVFQVKYDMKRAFFEDLVVLIMKKGKKILKATFTSYRILVEKKPVVLTPV